VKLEIPSSFAFDVAVIGGGSAGFAAARSTSDTGLRTAVIEGGRELGGLCILRGCMPSKALLWAAEVRHLAQRAETWGMKRKSVPFKWDKVMARKESMIRDFAADRQRQLTGGRFALIRSRARFLDPHTLDLGKGRTLTARHFVLATGSVVSPPPLRPLNVAGFITSDDAVTLRRLPESLIVLGGGSVAVELAQLFARFDVAVTLIQRSEHILRGFDSDATETLETVLRRDGVELFTGTSLLDARREGRKKVVEFQHAGKRRRVAAEEILLALGRSPNLASLDLDLAGVQTDGGRIITDERMRTTAPHIYAAGDCTSPHEVVHVAIAQGEVAAQNIINSRQPRVMDYRLLTRIVFTEPQIATVGLTEKEAEAKGRGVLVARYPFNDHGKSLIMDATDGFVKLLVYPATGEILGGACVGSSGGELIHEIVAAMHSRMTVGELAAMPHYHPTLAEIWTYPAEELTARLQTRSAGSGTNAARNRR